MNKAQVSVVIVNWNGREDTLACLDSLFPLYKKHGILVIVVDNGSNDGLIDTLKTSYPWVFPIRLPKNIGFAGGNNKGIKKALEDGSEFIWLLNNDTVVDKNALSILDGFRDSSVGACGSKIYFMKGREYHKNRYKKQDLGKVLWYAGGSIDWDNMYASHRGVDEVDHGQYDRREETPFITGCSMMLRKSVIEKIGFLNESYFMYFEDLEYCLRMQKHGYKTVYVPSSIVWHKNASSSGGSGSTFHEYYQTRNRLVLGLQYASPRTKAALLGEAMRFLVKGPSLKRQAIRDALSHKMGERV